MVGYVQPVSDKIENSHTGLVGFPLAVYLGSNLLIGKIKGLCNRLAHTIAYTLFVQLTILI